MKIALCLSGYFDSLTDLSSKGIDGFDHLKRHVFSKGDVDVYIHSWDKENESQIKTLYNPKYAIFEHQIDFSDLIKEKGYNIARRTISKYREQLNIPVSRLRKEI